MKGPVSLAVAGARCMWAVGKDATRCMAKFCSATHWSGHWVGNDPRPLAWVSLTVT